MTAGPEVGRGYVTIIPSTRGFQKDLAGEVNRASTQAGRSGGQAAGSGFAAGFGKYLPGIGAALAGVFTVGAVKDFVGESISAASDLAESQSKVTVVFGESAKAIDAWADTSATSLLLSKQAALEAAGTYGNLFQAFGIGQDRAAEMSTTLVQLAADLASFNNTSVDDAILALRSGLSGETEPLKRYGVAINDVRLKQEALNLGLWDGKGQLDVAAKAQATYSLVLKDTSLAQGDVDRTADGYANTMRAVQAAVQDAQATIGGEFLESINEATTALGGPESLVGLIHGFGDEIAAIIAQSSDGVAAIRGIAAALSDATTALTGVDGDTQSSILSAVLGSAWESAKNITGGPLYLLGGAYDELGVKAEDVADSTADLTFQNRLLNQALNQTAYAAPDVTSTFSDMATASQDASSGVDTLDTSIAKLLGRFSTTDAISNMEAAIDAFAGLDTTKTVGKGKKAHEVDVPFLAALNKRGTGFDLGQESGRIGREAAMALVTSTYDAMQAAAESGDADRARALRRRGVRALTNQLDDIGFDRPEARAWARAHLQLPSELTAPNEAGHLSRQPTSQTTQYIFTGDINGNTPQEVARWAAEAARAKARTNSGGGFPTWGTGAEPSPFGPKIDPFGSGK